MPESLVAILELFHGSNIMRLGVPFLLFSLVLVAAKGLAGLRLSDETLRSVTVTLSLLIINGYLASYLVISVDLTSPWYRSIGLPHLGDAHSGSWLGPTIGSLWKTAPWPFTVALLVVLFDFADYWTHRLMHRSLLWGIHAVHHSEQRMTWLSSSRVHFLETSIMRLSYLLLFGWIGFPLWELVAANTVAYLHNRYVHCDTGWNHGPLTKVIASPNWHRWHHSVDPAAFNKNYANIFPFFDVLFGTYYNPGRCSSDVGLAELPKPGVINQLLYPATHTFSLAKGFLVKLRHMNEGGANQPQRHAAPISYK